MKKFDVWLHPLGTGKCRVRVEGKDNANWLLARLCSAYVIKTNDSIRQDDESSAYMFDVLYPQGFSHFMLEELLETIPPVRLRMGFGMTSTQNEGPSSTS
jgi:hypothetical protein